MENSCPPLAPLEAMLKLCFQKNPEIGKHIPSSEELTAYIQWMIREFGDDAPFLRSSESAFSRVFNLTGNRISNAGARLMKDPHDARALSEIQDMYRHHTEDSFITDETDVSVGQMLRYMPSHWHSNDYFEVYYSFSGDCPVFFTNETVSVKPGTVLIVAPGVTHASPCFGDDKILMFYMLRSSTFDRVFWELIPPQNLLSTFFKAALSDRQPNAYLRFETGGDREIDRILHQIFEESLKGEIYQTQMMNSLMSTFFVLLLRRYEGTARLPRTEDFYWTHEYSGILSYIQSHYATVKLPELAEMFHYSEKQIRRIVEKNTGLQYRELITKLRMERSVHLLSRADMSIADVSAAVGYATISSFYRTFAAYYGCTPGEYSASDARAE